MIIYSERQKRRKIWLLGGQYHQVSARCIDLTNDKVAEHIAWKGCGGL